MANKIKIGDAYTYKGKKYAFVVVEIFLLHDENRHSTQIYRLCEPGDQSFFSEHYHYYADVTQENLKKYYKKFLT